ncbi:MAG TPA: hypothetical protein VI160_02500 [Gemmatimonadales bacterium]
MRIQHFLLALAALGVAACGDSSQPSAPEPPGTAAPAPPAAAVRNEQLARRVARALRDPAFRTYVKASLDGSPYREHKLHFQRFLARENGRAAAALARTSGDSASAVSAEAASAQPLELYFPVPGEREAWPGDDNVLVATAVRDHDVPVAFDVNGRRQELSPDHPPATPVLALVPVETDFDAPPARQICSVDCQQTGGGSGGAMIPGLYMTRSHIGNIGAFEGWLKGQPEFEVHVLGQQGTSSALTDYQCAGEKAAGPYFYDQNDNDWAGAVLLFTQNQLDAYKLQHPGQSMRVTVIEDDDGACTIKVDEQRFNRMLFVADSVYGAVTGGRDTTTGLGRYYKEAKAFQSLFSAVASWILTNDDVVGVAIADDVVGQFYPGYNWFLKQDNTLTTGWINLEMH